MDGFWCMDQELARDPSRGISEALLRTRSQMFGCCASIGPSFSRQQCLGRMPAADSRLAADRLPPTVSPGPWGPFKKRFSGGSDIRVGDFAALPTDAACVGWCVFFFPCNLATQPITLLWVGASEHQRRPILTQQPLRSVVSNWGWRFLSSLCNWLLIE